MHIDWYKKALLDPGQVGLVIALAAFGEILCSFFWSGICGLYLHADPLTNRYSIGSREFSPKCK